MKRLSLLPMLLFACAAVAAPPSASSSADAEQVGSDAARAADQAARAGEQAARASQQAARAGAEAAREAADAQKLADLQVHMSDLAQHMAELSARMGDQASASALRYLADSNSGMLGIAADPQVDGIHVQAVTPGGPAERAGLRAGDVITAIDGRRLSWNGPLLFRLSNLPPGKPVRLTLLRDGKTLNVRATPERLQPADWQATVRAAERAARQATASVRSPEFRDRIQAQIDQAMKESSRATATATRAGSNAGTWNLLAPWWGLNLAPLNPDLGRYFGTDQGALVLSRDAKRYPKLEPGDVITKVGGRSVARPQDAMRAFREAPDRQPIAVTVRRHGKPVTLAFQAPPHWLVLPPAPPPAPPAPPVPPSPSSPAPPNTPAIPRTPAVPPPPPASQGAA